MRSLALGLIRVSSKRQAAEGISLDMQVSRIRDYARFRDLDLVGIYGDPDRTARKCPEKREGLQSALLLARKQRIQHIIVYRLDRFARNTRECLGFIEDDLEANGCAFHSVTEQIDTGTPMGRFFLTVLAGLAQMESDMISERVADSMAEAREQGRRTARYAPIGFRVVPGQKELVANPQEQRAIGIAQDLAKKGLSLRKISRKLEDGGFVGRNGNPYPPTTIRKMVSGGLW